MTYRVFLDRFTAGLDDLTHKEQGDRRCVLATLDKTKRFSVFEATANATIARTLQKLFDDGYVTNTGGAYPWTACTLTDKGRALLNEQDD